MSVVFAIWYLSLLWMLMGIGVCMILDVDPDIIDHPETNKKKFYLVALISGGSLFVGLLFLKQNTHRIKRWVQK